VAVGGVFDEIMRAIAAKECPRIVPQDDAPRLFPSENSFVIKKFVMRSPGGHLIHLCVTHGREGAMATERAASELAPVALRYAPRSAAPNQYCA